MKNQGSPPTAAESQSEICRVLNLAWTPHQPSKFLACLKKPRETAQFCRIFISHHNEGVNGARGAMFLLNTETLVWFGPSPGTERFRRPFGPAALHHDVSKLRRTADTVNSPRLYVWMDYQLNAAVRQRPCCPGSDEKQSGLFVHLCFNVCMVGAEVVVAPPVKSPASRHQFDVLLMAKLCTRILQLH